ncbi:MAG: hydrogenase formation protein HypD [Elusimicrobia bacterium]|nr:hydrogenase formation protein HypD [Elusimicrobiota bacterium]
MKYLDEFRDPAAARRVAEEIRRAVTRPWTLMEVCGGQTHSIVKNGLDSLWPSEITLAHGPGCPVCVTPAEAVDKAVALAEKPEVILTSFGDMIRVPGSGGDLASARARGADVRVVYGPLDALALARREPDKIVVFFAVGFETTAPAVALAVLRARTENLRNFALLARHVIVPPALEAIVSSPGNRVQGFLAAGHVCTIMGEAAYRDFVARHKIPVVITGFEPVDILRGVLALVRQLETGRAEVENEYARVVRREGNRPAQHLLEEVFQCTDRPWRGFGTIPMSGLEIRPAFAPWDAEQRFDLSGVGAVEESGECRAGDVLRGLLKPAQCPAFGSACTPERPLGAPMVSSEGACAAYYRYRPVEVR